MASIATPPEYGWGCAKIQTSRRSYQNRTLHGVSSNPHLWRTSPLSFSYASCKRGSSSDSLAFMVDMVAATCDQTHLVQLKEDQVPLNKGMDEVMERFGETPGKQKGLLEIVEVKIDEKMNEEEEVLSEEIALVARTTRKENEGSNEEDKLAEGSANKDSSEVSNQVGAYQLGKLLVKFLKSNFLPLALVVGIIFGLLNPTPGCLAYKYYLSKLSTFGVFFISGLILKTKELNAAMEAWPAGLFGVSSILFLTPPFSRLIMQVHLVPPEFVTGVAIFCCMPTTLSSGVTLTQLVGGSSALALAMTVVSNLLGILIVPLSLTVYIGGVAGVPLPTKQLLKSLINTLLIPLLIGKILREVSSGVADFSDKSRHLLSVISAILISLIPWMQVSRSRSLLLSVKAEAFALSVFIGVVLHVMFLAINAIVLQLLLAASGSGEDSVFAKKENTRAVILVASQKTLPVTVAVIDQLGGALGESGLLVLPCIASHINQIIIDSFLVNWWNKKDQKHQIDQVKDIGP